MATKGSTGTGKKNMRKSTSRNTSSKKASSRNTSSQKRKSYQDTAPVMDEIKLILVLAVSIVLFLCNFGVVGELGKVLSDIEFGIFGLTAYVAPVFLFLMIAFGISNRDNWIAARKIIAGIGLFIVAGVLCELFGGCVTTMEQYQFKQIYLYASENHKGGGILAGSVAYLLYSLLDMIGTLLVLIVVGMIGLVVLTERSFIEDLRKGSERIHEYSEEGAARRQERSQARREESARRKEEMQEYRSRQEEERRLREEERRLQAEERAKERRLKEEEVENEKILRMDRKVTGIGDTQIERPKSREQIRDDIHEIMFHAEEFTEELEEPVQEDGVKELFTAATFGAGSAVHMAKGSEQLMEHTITITGENIFDEELESTFRGEITKPVEMTKLEAVEQISVKESFKRASGVSQPKKTPVAEETKKEEVLPEIKPEEQPLRKYVFPPLSLLQKSEGGAKGESRQKLLATAKQLEQTLATFGVKVTVTDISQGPAVTRFELQPEQGVKVSKIVGLSDDIKLNLAATDIRIEAPIPGKAAVGIEVPNKENTAVPLRDLLETKEFKDYPNNLAFAAGKDIGGKPVITDIAKMPHVLIAGATGSGKSVCINTLIMSILYKASPDDVKLIMIDPKVVELSVYNGIPHLLIPVVTEPKKAAGALHWGVAEMTDRYQKFADMNVRNLEGYNQKVEKMRAEGQADAPAKLPQIVIIVDELADLMMVAPGEVEEAICRLAQLARAAGIHLVIATQRPSVDVITGLIKANMPSRIAFAVSSGVDSRTILDMNGAEKLLGKGDMLFYPKGYAKPVRVQGAFVSDREVSDVVDYLKNQKLGNVYSEDIEEKIKNIGSSSSEGGMAGMSGGGSGVDELFVEAGRFIIEKDKASIGMLQRMFRIGFNRAARIMDQLCDAGVVGEEEGTKPRKILMSPEQFEQYVEESV